MRIISCVLFLVFSFFLQGCQNPIPEPHFLVYSQSFQKEKGLKLVNSGYWNQKLPLHYRSEKQLNVAEARQMIVQITSEVFHTKKINENFSLKDLEIWVSFVDKNGKHPSKEYIGFTTLSDSNLCYRHYDKVRYPYQEFCDYHTETLEEAIQLTKEFFSSSKSDHFMVSELEILARQEQIQLTICSPL